MDKSRLVGGIICLAIAGFLAIMNITQPPENLMFTVGEQNMPWVPVGVLALIGLVLVVGALRGKGVEKPAVEQQPPGPDAQAKIALNKRMETICWGLFFIMLGGFMFVDKTLVARGFWSIGVGLILLGLNAARYFYKIKMGGFTTFLGIASVLSGLIQVLGLNETIEGALFLIILGIYLLLKSRIDEMQIFGRVEEG